jgi:hypothetical protein
MVKGSGTQSVYGASYHAQTSIDKITSANPKPATIAKVQAQTQLRYELAIAEPGIKSLFHDISDANMTISSNPGSKFCIFRGFPSTNGLF